LLYRVSDILGKNVPIKEALQKVLDHLFDFLRRMDRGAFILLDPDTGEVREIIFRSKKSADKSVDLFCKEVVDEVLSRRKAIAVSDARAEGPEEIADTLRVHNFESVMCVPLVGVSQIVGVIYVDSVQRPFGFQKEDLSLFMDLGHRIAYAVENARLSSELSTSPDLLFC